MSDPLKEFDVDLKRRGLAWSFGGLSGYSGDRIYGLFSYGLWWVNPSIGDESFGVQGVVGRSLEHPTSIMADGSKSGTLREPTPMWWPRDDVWYTVSDIIIAHPWLVYQTTGSSGTRSPSGQFDEDPLHGEIVHAGTTLFFRLDDGGPVLVGYQRPVGTPNARGLFWSGGGGPSALPPQIVSAGAIWAFDDATGTWCRIDFPNGDPAHDNDLPIVEERASPPPPDSPQQTGIGGFAYAAKAIDVAHFRVTRSDVVTEPIPVVVPPKPPVVVVPPKPIPMPPKPPATEPCPPGQYFNFMTKKCEPMDEPRPPAPPAPPAQPPTMGADLRLMNGRFNLTCRYDASERGSGAGPALAQKYSEQSGVFTFFSPANWEVVVKYAVGQFFVSAMTDVAFVLTMKDLNSGEEKTFENASGNLLCKLVAFA